MSLDAEAVLGIDAAWTDGEPSGIALLRRQGEMWECLRAAPSYATFCQPSFGWSDRVTGAPVDPGAVLNTCRDLLGGGSPAVIAVDMPMASTPVICRREADNLVSRNFGHCKCAVHSPSPARPGASGRRLHDGFSNNGYALATSLGCRAPALLEVYPHVALLGLTGRSERLPYKAAKSTTYWPGVPAETRKARLLGEWASILSALGQFISHANLPLPEDPEKVTFGHLKRFEDALDGLVCAWVATQYLQESALPLGDDTAAIWVPISSMKCTGTAYAT